MGIGLRSRVLYKEDISMVLTGPCMVGGRGVLTSITLCGEEIERYVCLYLWSSMSTQVGKGENVKSSLTFLMI